MDMPPLFLWLDPYLIWFFRLTDHAGLNFFLGTAAMAGLALIMGKLSSALIVAGSRRHTQELTDKAKKYQDLSIQALEVGDRQAYEAANKMANEAFGKSFFLGVAQSAGFFWPIGLVLAWMQYRFFGIAFPVPGLDWSVNFIGVFIPLYILCWVLLSRGKRFIRTRQDLAGVPNTLTTYK
ncbi:MAG: hypothetical protein FJ135_13495 [Deltaproteobacteria bacterium]|nr:hypothetical protein [Deltaproteobacteria bacterium]